jgi:SagB-type dehydrogenase family enzyme
MKSDQVVVRLPEPRHKGPVSLEEILMGRRSQRDFVTRALTTDQLSQVLWAAYGMNASPGRAGSHGESWRTAPSAGGCYPYELYIVTGEVTGIEPGLYHYLSGEHSMKQVLAKDLRPALSVAALGQQMIRAAPVSLVYSVVYERTTFRYGERGRTRYIPMDVGHSAQAGAMGLGTCAVGAFDDARVKSIMNLPPDEEPFYIMPVGYYRK